MCGRICWISSCGPTAAAIICPPLWSGSIPPGPQVKVELRAKTGDLVQVDLAHERFSTLQLTPGAEVFLRPKEAKVFIYQI